jgi:hypothetical protein
MSDDVCKFIIASQDIYMQRSATPFYTRGLHWCIGDGTLLCSLERTKKSYALLQLHA